MARKAGSAAGNPRPHSKGAGSPPWISATIGALFILAALAAFTLARPALVTLTGEHAPLAQVRALGQLAVQAARPPLDLRPEAVRASVPPVSPYGVNTFLQLEADPQVREHSAQMLADAGFTWVRQEFAWYDLEVGGKGVYTDTRQTPPISAWAKYDDIVSVTARHNLRLIARLGAPPSWTRADGDARGAFAPPDNLDDYGDFVYAVVSRYAGRVTHWQIWNEPNIYPEWGNQPVDPEAYTRMLCLAYRRAKEADPHAVIIAAALAPTIELGAGWEKGNNLSDLVFLDRMYRAGAGACFDILSVQGYGLFSGPYDHRTTPLQTNINRHLLLRDIMVRYGDAHKPIWISEMNWNAVPDSVPDHRFGQVSEAEQADYAVALFERARTEWPWIEVICVWFFKRPDESERNQAWYYFRLVEPDFTPLPVYDALKTYMHAHP